MWVGFGSVACVPSPKSQLDVSASPSGSEERLVNRTVNGVLPASASARKSARGARFAPPPALPPPALLLAGERSSWTEPARNVQPQGWTIVSCTGVAALIVKLVVSSVVGELPLHSAGANGMFAPSAFL